MGVYLNPKKVSSINEISDRTLESFFFSLFHSKNLKPNLLTIIVQ